MSSQYIRKLSIVVGTGSTGIELAPDLVDQLKIKFSIQQWDLQTPNRASVRIMNLSAATSKQIENEFTRLVIQAGYQNGSYGLVFDGTIVQVRRGRENATDTYLDVVGAEGDEATNFAVVSATLAAGSTFHDRVTALAQAMSGNGVSLGYVAPLPATQLPRGKVLFGMARDHLRDLAFSSDTTFNIQKGQLQIVPRNGYLPNEVVVLNSNTGMIGLPEQTQEGIRIRSLMNTRLVPAARVQIDNKSIQQAFLNLSYTGVESNAFLPSITDDGVYRIIVCEHEGDTRGNDWYTNIICVAQNEGVNPSLIAKGYS